MYSHPGSGCDGHEQSAAFAGAGGQGDWLGSRALHRPAQDGDAPLGAPSLQAQPAFARLPAGSGSRAISTMQVIEDLIKLAKELNAATKRGENMGLTDDVVALFSPPPDLMANGAAHASPGQRSGYASPLDQALKGRQNRGLDPSGLDVLAIEPKALAWAGISRPSGG